jgi:hypothetical protein
MQNKRKVIDPFKQKEELKYTSTGQSIGINPKQEVDDIKHTVTNGVTLLNLDELASAIKSHICRDDIQKKKDLLATRDSRKKQFWVCIALMALGVVITLIMVQGVSRFNPGMMLPLAIGCAIAIYGIIALRRAKADMENFKPKRRINSIKVGRLILGSKKGGRGSYVFDWSGLAETSDLVIPQADAPDKIETLRQAHHNLTRTTPDILPPDHATRVSLEEHQLEHTLFAEEARIHKLYQMTHQVFDTMKSERVKTPLIQLSESEVTSLLMLQSQLGRWLTTPNIKLKENDLTAEVEEIITRLEGEVDPKGTASQGRQKVSTLFNNFLEQISQDQEYLDSKRHKSLTQVMPVYSNDLERIAIMNSYNCYCPKCNTEVIRNSADQTYNSSTGEFPGFDFATRVRPVKGSNAWECPVCAHQTEQPFPVHKLLDELVYPTMDKLLQENRVERIRIYHEAQDKKRQVIDGIQKDIRLLVESTEKEAREFQARIREIASGVDGAKETIELLARELVNLESLRNTRISELSQQMNRHIQEIAKFKQDTMTSYRDSMKNIMAQANKDISHLAQVARQEEQARMAVQQKIAQGLQESVTAQHQLTENIQQSNELLTKGNEINSAMLGSQGGYRSTFPNVIGQAEDNVGDFVQEMTGQSEYERYRSKGHSDKS